SLSRSGPSHDPHSFPTRRSSDLRAHSAPERDMATEYAPGRVGQSGVQVRAVRRHRSRERDDLEGTVKNVRILGTRDADRGARQRSEEHTSELQSLAYLVCRLLLE